MVGNIYSSRGIYSFFIVPNIVPNNDGNVWSRQEDDDAIGCSWMFLDVLVHVTYFRYSNGVNTVVYTQLILKHETLH